MKDKYTLEMDTWLQSVYDKIAIGRLILGYLSQVMEGSMSADIEVLRPVSAGCSVDMPNSRMCKGPGHEGDGFSRGHYRSVIWSSTIYHSSLLLCTDHYYSWAVHVELASKYIH